ncbi:MAG: hypothetical protein JWL84_6130 [Rhodospirillales bacterium]|jgi:hypothetical protein|nr:hypothetical protein [Rhodospirillales bacterium]
MKKPSRTSRSAGRSATGVRMAHSGAVESAQDEAAKACLKALDASLSAGSAAGGEGYAATALELAALATQMTGELTVALKILREAAQPQAYALDALDRLLAASNSATG